LDENHAELAKYLKANRIVWPQIVVTNKGQTGWNNPLARYYRVTSIPFTIIVDKQGVIAESGIRSERNIENVLLDLLAQ
jgi:ribosomal protein L39E